MDTKKLAADLVQKVGGKGNISNVTHCVTRLRFVVKDAAKVDADGIKGLDGVLDLVLSSGQHQVVIGPKVGEVYNAVVALVGEGAAAAPAGKPKEKLTLRSAGKAVLDTIVSCFTPAIPIIAGSGMVKVLVVLLNYAGLLDSASTTYTILNTIGDGIFYFLPVVVAINAARKMNVDMFTSVALSVIIMHPNLLALGETGTTVPFLCFDMPIMNYSAQALPMIFGVWLLKYVDKVADKVSPSIVKVFLRPMIDLLIVAPVILLVVGPISISISNVLFAACAAMQTWGPIAVAINALLFPLMVLTGTHNATIPLIVQMFATQGYDPIFLVCGLAANMAEAGAACAVAVKTRNKSLRSTGFTATLSALLGITEPALYGVNLRMKRPFISMLIGATLGGFYCGLIGLQAPAFVTPSLLTIAILVPQGINYLLGLSCVPVCFAITFAVTYIIGFEDLPAEK